MTTTRKLVFLTLAIGSAVALKLSWNENPKPAIYLSERLPQASSGPLLAITGKIGSYQATPFLGKGWDQHEDLELRTTLGRQRDAVIRFYLTEPEAINIELEGRCLTQMVKVELGLQQTDAQPFELETDWTRCKLAIPASAVKVGLNQLIIHGSQPTQWRNCTFRLRNSSEHNLDTAIAQAETTPSLLSPTPNEPTPLAKPTSNATEKEPRPLAPDQPIRLAFGHSLEFPVLARPGMMLNFDGIEPWIEPGAPSLKTPWTLQVKLQSNSKSGKVQSWDLQQGSSQHLTLEIDSPRQVSLSLMARSSEKLLPGQAGLLVRKARLEIPTLSSSSQTASLPTLSEPDGKASKPPDVILFVIDTLRSDSLHCYGAKTKATAHFDALATDGVRFANCMAQSSWTKAAMGSIMTSMLPQRHLAEDFPDVLAPWLPKLSKLLQEAHYDTLAVVSNPFVGREFGFADGFNQFVEKPDANAHQITVEALQQLEKREKKQPFFLYVHVLDPHLPYSPPSQFRPKQGPSSFSVNDMKALRQGWETDGANPERQAKVELAKALYAGEIASCDQAFGNFIEILKKQGLYQNSLIVVVSDHGEQFFEHGLCDHMNSLYQELLHVPLIIKFPDQEGAGKVEEPVWQHIDITPTILRAAGIEAPVEMQGVAYSPTGSSGNPDRAAYFSLKVGTEAAHFGQSDNSSLKAKAELEGIRVGPWVFQLATSTLADLEPIQLFNLEDDPNEFKNQAYSRSDLRCWLAALLSEKSRSKEAAPQASNAKVDSSLNGLQYLR